jgi:iron(III) transport system ATP-binding protein
MAGIRFAFHPPDAVLDGVGLEVRAGELVALLGPSGCGKTTLLRLVAGLLRPDSGTIALNGRVVAGPGIWVPTEGRGIGLVPQEGALFPHLDVGRNVGFGLRGMPRTQRDACVAECLDLVGLGGSARRRPSELSGGQQQRVALARALAPGPAVILLDEPFSALDAGLRAQLRDEVREVLQAADAAALLVTHDQEEALSFADRVAVLREGRLAQVADPVTLYERPSDLEVAEFVGESVVIPAVLDPTGNGSARSILGDLVVSDTGTEPSSGAVWAVIRPEQLELHEPGVASGAPAAVVSWTYFGHDALVRLRLDAPEASGAEVLARIQHHRRVERGMRVTVTVTGSVPVFADGRIPPEDDASR